MSNKVERTAPEIRFKGFTDDWEKQKLINLAIFSKGRGYSKNDLQNTGSPIILYGRMYTDYKTVISEIDTYVEMKTDSSISEGNEVIIPASGETAQDISRASFIEKPGIILGGDLNVVRPNDSINPIFLVLTISNGAQQKEMIRRAQGKSIVHLHNSDLKNIILNYPVKEEQNRISRTFQNIDKLLTVQKRKLEALKQLKQALLQQMFPQKDEVNPRVRFANFHDAWEQRKLGEIASLRGGFAFKSENFQDQGIPIIRISNINASGIVKGPFEYYKEQKNDEMYFLPNKSILLAMSGATTGKIAVINDSEKNKYYQNQRVGYFKKNEKYSYEFILPLVKSKKFMDQLNSVLVAGAQPNISSKEINNFNFEVSTNIFEQSLIGSIFDLVSKEIGIQIKKNESTNVIKQSLLQKMFI